MSSSITTLSPLQVTVVENRYPAMAEMCRDGSLDAGQTVAGPAPPIGEAPVAQEVLLLAHVQDDNRIVFCAVLVHHGYNVVLATNRAEAVEQARSNGSDSYCWICICQVWMG